MRLLNPLNLFLQLLNDIVLVGDNLIEFLGDSAGCSLVDVGRREQFRDLGISGLHSLLHGIDFFLKDKILQAALSLDIVNGLLEILVEFVAFLGNGPQLLLQHLVLKFHAVKLGLGMLDFFL